MPTSTSSIISFDFEYLSGLNGYNSIIKMQGFYQDSKYYGSIGLRADKTSVRMTTQSEWTKVCYGGTVYDPTNMSICIIHVYYK